jgi:hypothetical protein
MSIKLKINLLLLLFGSLTCFVIAGFNYYVTKNRIFEDAFQKAQLISSFAMASRDYTVETMRPLAMEIGGKGIFHPELMAGLFVARSIGNIFSKG